MIEYSRGPYGANLLFRWHGSALAKAFIPGLLSVGFYLALHYLIHYDQGEFLNHVSNAFTSKLHFHLDCEF